MSEQRYKIAFAVGTCIKYKKKLLLRWCIGERKLVLQQGLRLDCPTSSARFDQVFVELPALGAGKEQFSATAPATFIERL